MRAIGGEARAAARVLANAPAEAKTRALLAAARALRERARRNPRRQRARPRGGARQGPRAGSSRPAHARSPAHRGESRAGWRRSPPCPIRSGACSATFERPNGLKIERVATPLGVVGVIYESRPNVTADAGALCLKSGNAVGAARRLRQLPFLGGDPRLPRRRPRRKPACPRRRFRARRSPRARRSARCSRG